MKTPQMRSRFWTFLSLWSLIALAAPQLMWACPMMGGISSGMSSSLRAGKHNVNDKCCCAKKVSAPSNAQAPKCCDIIPIPGSDTSGDSDKLALTSQRTLASSLANFVLPSTPAVLPALELLAPQSVAIAYSPTTSPPLISQHSTRLTSGRAPPF